MGNQAKTLLERFKDLAIEDLVDGIDHDDPDPYEGLEEDLDKIRKDTATYPQVADVLQEFGFDVHAILTLVIQAYFGDNRMPPDLDLAFADLGYLE